MFTQATAQRTATRGAGMQPETQAWYNRATVKPDQLTLSIIDRVIGAMKASGVFQVSDAAYFYIANDIEPSLLNIVKPQWDGTPIGDVADNFTPYQGVQGDGYSVAIDSGFMPSANLGAHYTKNSAHMWMFSLTNLSVGSDLVGAAHGGISAYMRIDPSGEFYAQANSETGISIKTLNVGGFCAWSRSNATDVLIYKCGTSNTLELDTIAEFGYVAVPQQNIRAFQAGLSTAPYDSNTLTAWGFGGALTLAQLDALYQAVLAAMFECGAVDEASYAPEITLPGYWTSATMAAVAAVNPTGFRVYQEASPPHSNSTDNTTYVYWPATDWWTLAIDQAAASTATDGTMITHHIWDNRVIVTSPTVYNVKPNTLPGQWNGSDVVLMRSADNYLCWTQYTTLQRAMGATEVMVRWSLGLPETNPGFTTDPVQMGWGDCATFYGLTTIPFATAAADIAGTFPNVVKTTGGTYATCVDTVVLSPARLVDCPSPRQRGIGLDSEPQDGRAAADQLAHVQRIAAICAWIGFEFNLYVNSFEDTGAARSGYDITNLPQIHQTAGVSSLCLIVWKGATVADYGDQIATLLGFLYGPDGDQPVNFAKLILTIGIGFGLQQTQVSDAAEIRAALADNDWQGVHFWRDNGVAGGVLSEPYNQVIATVLGLPTS
jgi:hypothetical protein